MVKRKNTMLIDEYPLMVLPKLARAIGLNEAVVLQQIHYWLQENERSEKNYHEGRYWTYNSIRAWQETNFPFWSINTVDRTFTKLRDMGLLIAGNFNRAGFDKTTWYTIDYDVVDAITNDVASS